MKRRRFHGLLLGASFAGLPVCGALAQAKPKLRIAAVSARGSRNDRVTGFTALFERLAELGYVEGRNLEVDFDSEGIPATTFGKFVRSGGDIIFVQGTDLPLGYAVAAAQGRVPIVMMATDYDPLEKRYVESLARPGGNITGLFVRQPELAAKRVELAHEALPASRRIIILDDPVVAQQVEAAARTARSLGLDIEMAGDPLGHEWALRHIQTFGPTPIIVPSAHYVRVDREVLCRVALERRLALIAPQREFVEVGALLSYGINFDDAYRRAADYIYRIAGGAKPADLPIEQPTRFELVINLTTARALGVTIPPALFGRADEVIE
jgi:putative ABC transport system substrate-binding protein